MGEIIAIVLPVFGLVAVGYASRWAKFVGPRTGEGLSDYVFSIATPALIFKTLAFGGSPSDSPWGYWIAYFSGVAIVWAIGQIAARRLFGRPHVESVIQGFTAGQGNTVMLGIPLVLARWGEAGATPLFLLIAIHLPLMLAAATILIETDGKLPSPRRAGQLALTLLKNPILLGIIAGALGRIVGLEFGGVPRVVLEQIGATAAPCALLALGMALKNYGLTVDPKPALLISFLKLMVHPALVWVLAVHVLHLPPVYAGVAVLFAAAPSGINTYLLAVRYDTATGTIANAVALSTFLGAITTMFWLHVIDTTIPRP